MQDQKRPIGKLPETQLDPRERAHKSRSITGHRRIDHRIPVSTLQHALRDSFEAGLFGNDRFPSTLTSTALLVIPTRWTVAEPKLLNIFSPALGVEFKLANSLLPRPRLEKRHNFSILDGKSFSRGDRPSFS